MVCDVTLWYDLLFIAARNRVPDMVSQVESMAKQRHRRRRHGPLTPRDVTEYISQHSCTGSQALTQFFSLLSGYEFIAFSRRFVGR